MTSTTASFGSAAVPAAGGERVDSQFELVALVKQGNGIDTYSGIDHLHGADVVIKTVETATIPTAVYMRLDHEARLLERLDLGRTRRVLWCGQCDRFFYVVQPHVEGEPLDQVLADGPLTVPDCLALATGLLATLAAVHELGVLHRDIKPSNIIVRHDGTSLSAELVDFGLTRGGNLDREPAGTVRYIAPEAAGLITGVIDQRADLYSVGIVLFECLAGRPPFSGGTIGEALRLHLNVPAPQLRSMGIAVPRSLEGVLQRLLAKDPTVRYQSAASARSDIDAIAAAIRCRHGGTLRDAWFARPAPRARRARLRRAQRGAPPAGRGARPGRPVRRAGCSSWRPSRAPAKPASSMSSRSTPPNTTSSSCGARVSIRPPHGPSRCSRASLPASSPPASTRFSPAGSARSSATGRTPWQPPSRR